MPEFDPLSFMNQTIDKELDTEFFIPPEGDYRAVIQMFDQDTFKPAARKDGTPVMNQNGQQSIVFEPRFNLEDDGRLKGRDGYQARGQMWLDIDDQGRINTESGRNVLLGQMMKAAGIKPGQPLSDLGGGRVMVKLSHESDKNNPARKYVRVDRVTGLK